jgi:hypothetical protein
MAGAMSMDSPQAQNSTEAKVLCVIVLSFPLVRLLCGILSPVFAYTNHGVWGVVAGSLPWVDLALFFLYMLAFGEK